MPSRTKSSPTLCKIVVITENRVLFKRVADDIDACGDLVLDPFRRALRQFLLDLDPFSVLIRWYLTVTPN
jgi:hypothetical protein